MKNLAVLLTVHNRKQKTLECLKHLFSQANPELYNMDVYLTDDGSTDGSKITISKQFPTVSIINGDGTLFWNRGMIKSWNEAAKAKQYDFYLWLNNDVCIKKNAINILLETSGKYKNKAIIVGSTYSGKDNSKITYGGRDKRGKLLFVNGKPEICYCFNGNLVLVPAYVYNIIGTNDPVFHHFLGDFDYGLRATKLGIQSIVAPVILGCCDEHEGLPVWCNPQKSFKQRWNMFRSPLGNDPNEFFIFEKRHHGLFMACFHYFTNHLRVIFPSIWNKK